MGTGKTAVGRALAAALDAEFVDTDEVIEQRHGPIPRIFVDQGEAAFRALEAALAEELAAGSGRVISTGGGMLLADSVAQRLGSTGRIFCLVASPETILARVQADRSGERPLLDVDDPARRIAQLLGERATRYGVRTDRHRGSSGAGDRRRRTRAVHRLRQRPGTLSRRTQRFSVAPIPSMEQRRIEPSPSHSGGVRAAPTPPGFPSR